MPRRIGTGPVFRFECLMAARRWQAYAGRALLVAGMLAALSVMWTGRIDQYNYRTYQELAIVGRTFFGAMISVELVLVLLVAPAATAGAVCHDRSRGGLTHFLVTDLSDSELVLGKLAARLASVLGIIACGLPVLGLCTLLGGVDPVEIAGATLVIVGCAVLGVSVALCFSVWATKAHEALTATYAVWAVWLLALLVWTEAVRRGGAPLLEWSHPFWLLFARHPSMLLLRAQFLAGCLAISAVLALVATLCLRPVTVRRAGRIAVRRREAAPSAREIALLDRDPIFWRERRRKRVSAWTRGIWWLFGVLATFFSLVSLVWPNNIAPGTSAFQVSIGLLLVSVSAATALAEERAQGSLDVVLATPLSTRQIVRGKWRGAFRVVPRLAILPSMIVFFVGWNRSGIVTGVVAAVLSFGLVLGYGAVVVSFGLLAALWQRRLGRAVAISVTGYLAVTLVWPAFLLSMRHGPPSRVLPLMPSPFFGMFCPSAALIWRGPFGDDWAVSTSIFLFVTWAAAAVMSGLALATFDRCVGRVREQSVPVTAKSDVWAGDRRVAWSIAKKAWHDDDAL